MCIGREEVEEEEARREYSICKGPEVAQVWNVQGKKAERKGHSDEVGA